METTVAADPPVGRGALPSGLRVRGHDVAASAALDLVRRGGVQSILFVGPGGLGKTTLALDLATALLCGAPAAERPCGACRGCRMVESGNHPDVHRLRPEGPGGQIRIGARSDADPGTVRRLLADLALLPVEGGARVAIVERADRMNEDAQSALLKTLEEPPSGVTIILCADEEERLLPTIRSRCARLRLGPVGTRAIETILAELGAADAPTAARLARLSGGRPGVALSWARAPAAVAARGEIARVLIDLLAGSRAARLSAARALLGSAGDAVAALEAGAVASDPATPARRRRGNSPPPPTPNPSIDQGDGDGTAAVSDQPAEGGSSRRAPAAERRRAALLLVDVWRDVARDLSLVALGERRRLRDPGLLEDLETAAPGLPDGAAAAFLRRLDRAGELLESNVGPELVVDALVLAWPRLRSMP